MDKDPIIAIDAMGGDFAPDEIVRGAAKATLESSINLILVGDKNRIEEILNRVESKREQIEIVHTDEFITNEDSPRFAVMRKQAASLNIATKLCGNNSADGVVSAGSTGAYVLSSLKNIPRIGGVHKVAIASMYPTHNIIKRGSNLALLLDAGANIYCNPEDLVQFAIMGKCYATDIRGIEDPTVAILNIGKESHKGGHILSRVHEVLKKLPNINFIGNIEGNDIMNGVADVVVTEGYVGNIVMKTMEGMVDTLNRLGKFAFRRKLLWKIGLIALSSGLRALKRATDYSEYGGAPFLGFQKLVVKSHGRSRARAITNAIKLAARGYSGKICDRIAQEIANSKLQLYFQESG